MKRLFITTLCLGLLMGCETQHDEPAPAPSAPEAPLGLGFDTETFNMGVRPQDDFYRYVNGTWLETTDIPADKSNFGAFTQLADQAEIDLRTIIEKAAMAEYRPAGSEVQKVGDLYRSYMDSTRVEDLGLTPLEGELARVDAIASHEDLIRYIGYNQRIGVTDPFSMFVGQDAKNATEYILFASQSGLGLPDRDYYFSNNFAEVRDKYTAYIATMYDLAEWENGEAAAATIFDLEQRLAEHHWTRVQNRDRDATYNKYTFDEANALTPNLDWGLLLEAADATTAEAIIIRQPSYFEAVNTALAEVPLDAWKTYFQFKVLNGAASMLPQPFVDANFDFYSRTLSGIEAQRPRWKRAVSATNGTLGEMVGKLYVEEHFSPDAKTRMDEMIANLRTAFRQSIDGLEWMSPETRAQAQEKLQKFTPKIGYPEKWKDYEALEVDENDLFGNIRRSREVEYARNLNKLGNPVDRTEWFMTPQTVNAYYSPSMNEIVFPAAILQPPFFNVEADDAVNYGAIGAVIGHEFSHGFDDQGRKSDGDGNLRDWWTEEDADEFKTRAQGLIDQYAAFSPLDGLNVNGELTLGENIGDLAGLTMAYRAYQLSLNGEEAPVIDGFTGDQRFFIGWAQVWRRKYRDDELKRRLITDPHSPSEYRTNGIVANMPEFYAAFNVQPGDPMHRNDEERVKIW